MVVPPLQTASPCFSSRYLQQSSGSSWASGLDLDGRRASTKGISVYGQQWLDTDRAYVLAILLFRDGRD